MTEPTDASPTDAGSGMVRGPGAPFHDGVTTPIEPDVRAWLQGGEVVVALVGGRMPDLHIDLNLPGEHNVRNALAAIAVALEVGASVEAIQKGLLAFEGVGRRFQNYGEIALPNGGKALVIDDYGHHPVEMAATLAAARGAYPDKRLVLAFQPHRYTRTRDLFEDFVNVLSTVDSLVLTEVYAAGEEPIVAADSRALDRKSVV